MDYMRKSYSLDLSAIIHLASMAKSHSSSYRFAVIVAGIHSDFYNYKVVAVEKSPKVSQDHTLIATFSKEEIRECVPYSKRSIRI